MLTKFTAKTFRFVVNSEVPEPSLSSREPLEMAGRQVWTLEGSEFFDEITPVVSCERTFNTLQV